MRSMDSFDDLLLDYSFIDGCSSPDFSWLDPTTTTTSSRTELDISRTSTVSLNEGCLERCTKKRASSESCSKMHSKSCHEKRRRERLNEGFLELSSILVPGRTAKMDKLVILSDTIRVLNQLQNEAKEFKDENETLQEEIRSLKAEKNELHEEKHILKAEKERIAQQLKAAGNANCGLIPPHLAAYHAGVNKMTFFPGYGLLPMMHYLPPSARDTSGDHELRPPAA